jgi:hypothetical protein
MNSHLLLVQVTFPILLLFLQEIWSFWPFGGLSKDHEKLSSHSGLGPVETTWASHFHVLAYSFSQEKNKLKQVVYQLLSRQHHVLCVVNNTITHSGKTLYFLVVAVPLVRCPRGKKQGLDNQILLIIYQITN